LFIACFGILGATAQIGPNIPDDLVLQTDKDYEDHLGLARKSLAWLINTPLDEHLDKRNEVNAFVMLWLSGSPTITVEIDSKATPFIHDDETLIFPFIHGMALYQLGHPACDNKAKLHAEGLRVVNKANKQSKCVKSTKTLKAISKAAKRNNLAQLAEDWLSAE
jgi:hypothetical protein